MSPPTFDGARRDSFADLPVLRRRKQSSFAPMPRRSMGRKDQAAKSFRTLLMRSMPSVHTWITSSGLISRIYCGDLCTLTPMASVGAGSSRA